MSGARRSARPVRMALAACLGGDVDGGDVDRDFRPSGSREAAPCPAHDVVNPERDGVAPGAARAISIAYKTPGCLSPLTTSCAPRRSKLSYGPVVGATREPP